jgi:hypothetical protein
MIFYSQCDAWLNNHFKVSGDQIPNMDQIHLEAQEKSAIWNYYSSHIDNIFMEDENLVLCYSKFIKLWQTGYFHVKIREYKAVTGKCNACALLNEERNKVDNSHIRQKITDLHALHRMTFMAEKRTYYAKISLAVNEPEFYWSGISDGFAQNHTQMPWLANLNTFPGALNPKLQGFLEHGEIFVIIII